LEANKPSDVMRDLIDAEPDMQCVGQVSLADEVVSAAQATGANVLILDLLLQGGSAMPLLDQLAQAMPGLRVIVFSGLAHAEEASREARRRGAAAFVPKGGDFQVLLAALRARPRAAG
jgi:DNA-binding NarL/FixJ family response regulator